MKVLKQWFARLIAAKRGGRQVRPPAVDLNMDMVEPGPAAPAAAREAPPVSPVPGVADAAGYWPASLAHLALPYDNGVSDYVTIAQISESPSNGYVGYREVSVGLVPLDIVEEVMRSTAATDWEVDSHGPLPVVDDGDPPHKSGFWIEGFDRDTRFEPLVNAWSGGDIEVVVPDNRPFTRAPFVWPHASGQQLGRHWP